MQELQRANYEEVGRRLPSLPRMVLSYEQLQADNAGTMRRVAAFLGGDGGDGGGGGGVGGGGGGGARTRATAAAVAAVAAASGANAGAPRHVKTGGERLRSLVSNAAEVADWLSTHAGPCLRAQFDAETPACERCANPWPAERCDVRAFNRHTLVRDFGSQWRCPREADAGVAQ